MMPECSCEQEAGKLHNNKIDPSTKLCVRALRVGDMPWLTHSPMPVIRASKRRESAEMPRALEKEHRSRRMV